jgi:predicted enzyme related to lactoylglutathione lyase
MEKPKVGTISWTDLTVPNAAAVKDFYAAVAGWGVMPIDKEGYEDFCMMPPGSDQPAAGICHARGPNADLPSQWLVYITVPDVVAALKTCVEKGGKVIREVRDMGGAKMAVIQDPAGAVAALYQPGEGSGTC